ncbi:Do family serine endopeptidase [Candidatus Fermentibacterales bacterium]|nr:Do family serine endopeptidase [Candidatus Fermentibacterales bacterium]
MRHRPETRAGFLLLLVSVLALVSMAVSQDYGTEPDAAPDTVYIVNEPDLRELSDIFVDIADRVGPSVVTITSRTTFTAIVPGFPSVPFGGFDPWGGDWRDLFPEPREQEFVREGLGSGVIVRPDGYIVSNHHVVGEADDLEVILDSGERYRAELVGTDPRTDLAVIRIEAGDLPAITFGSGDSLRVGQWVLAVGSPFALSQTVTQGIVSYIGRTNVGLSDFENYIQTDAAINPGNSGGALVDLDGRLVGVNTAIASRTGSYQGVGFAIPVEVVESVLDDLIDHGYVLRGWLGVVIQDLSPELARQFDAGEEAGRGILVSDVLPDTPAEHGGLMRGDILLELDGREIVSVAQFRSDIAFMKPGDTAELDLLRDGRRRSLSVDLGQRPDEEIPAPREPSGSDIGWKIRTLDAEEARQTGEPGLEGVLVLEVDPAGLAARSGLRAGDVILEADRSGVTSARELERVVSQAGGDLLLLVLREGSTIYLVLETS